MSSYLMRLTPQEPYFFGNEKTFAYPGQDGGAAVKRYFITSERVPSQTTLIGALRYILLPVKKEYGKYTADDLAKNNATVGERSFQYGQDNSFGKIKRISPLFLTGADGRFVVTPFDHTPGNTRYTPFDQYAQAGSFLYPVQYDAKTGIRQSYMRVEDGQILELSELFTPQIRVGIKRQTGDSGFFKKEYVILKEGFSFAAYITVDDDVTPQDMIVYLGQGKSLFLATFEQVEENAEQAMQEQIRSRLRRDVVYCFSDVFASGAVYGDTRFAITELKDYRTYTTSCRENGTAYYRSVEKGSSLYKLIRAGSIFIPACEHFAEKFDDPQVQVIGFNTMLNGGK